MNNKLDLSCPPGTHLFEGRVKSHLGRLRSEGGHTRKELMSIILGEKRRRIFLCLKSAEMIDDKDELDKLSNEELEELIAKVTSIVE